ncbi:Type 1 glutamine amidotransferase-like domain-containing protein [Segetibacter sp.]|jgi:peptidase E|uniref:Type 1 glutamine amidotransferase-like domain-containing protein n=1 Tax=Segetibacter sp. TaxID=2231182 RepID=UPI002610963A|nr:Type 1 glutamine amidotransferase-like domain-containing protein [Segetibacter sp.]MCW3081225.1 peptidase [Segetibacter sp.]
MQTKPLFLFADSQLLFIKNDRQEYYLQSAVNNITNPDPSCAYIGASNNDEPVFYELFAAAMQNLGLRNCKKISSSFDKDDREFLDKADLILLAGGDTELGLNIMKENGIDGILQRKYAEGCILIGVSAGAIQLGWQSFKATDERMKATEAFKFLPFIVLVHQDKDEVVKVESLLKISDTIKRAYEIPWGAGLIFHPDNTVEAIRKPINEFILKEDTLAHTLIFPGNFCAAGDSFNACL